MHFTWKVAIRFAMACAIALVSLSLPGEFARPLPARGVRAPAGAASLAGGTTQAAREVKMEGPLVGGPAQGTLTVAVRDLPPAQPEQLPNGQVDRREFHLSSALDGVWGNAPGEPDALLALSRIRSGYTPTPTMTVEGVGNMCGCSPPDTIGDAGPNHYVQMVNATAFNVYDKDGALYAGYPKDLSTLWASGGCASSSNGDPIVIYDSLADRWLLAQFSNGNGVCVALSQTGDPTGAYYGYEFTTPSFPDYFKIAVWPDAYYMSANESTYSAIALERPAMLTGGAARSVRFAGEDNFLMAADVDGPNPPPSGSPEYYYTFKDNSYHGGVDRLEISQFHVDWTNPGSSTFGVVDTLPITAFTYTVCGYFVFNCIPQGGTAQRVDAVSEWPMWRLAYRNFGDHQTLVANFTIDVSGSDLAGIRWYELRKGDAGPWSIYQEGTQSPDATQRWMGSIAMDRDGNIALGYSTSSGSLNPSLRYATRLASDPLGTLETEQILYQGNGSQTTSNRWGDYSAMSVDPADDCTFWYTNEYYPSNSGNGWHTRVGKFKIPSCGGPVELPNKVDLPFTGYNATVP